MTSSSCCIVLVSPLLLFLLKQLSQRILPSLFHPADGQFEEKEGMDDVCVQGRAKKNLAKFSATYSVRADGLCIGSPRLVGGRKAGNSNMQEFFCTTLYMSQMSVCRCTVVLRKKDLQEYIFSLAILQNYKTILH